MRVLSLYTPDPNTPAGPPSAQHMSEMGKYNAELIKSGVLVDGAGLQASAKGARVRFSGKKRIVIDGPFTETKELLAGYWTIQVKSLQDAIEWARRCPHPHPGEDAEIELRQVFETEDFPNAPAEVVAQEAKFRKDRAKR